jgi:hypothetical protein
MPRPLQKRLHIEVSELARRLLLVSRLAGLRRFHADVEVATFARAETFAARF